MWGVTCMRYEIRDIIPSASVKSVMDMEAEAESESRTALTLCFCARALALSCCCAQGASELRFSILRVNEQLK